MKKYKLIAENQKGQSLVEMALSITMLFILISGMINIGLALFKYVSMRDAAQEGALYGSINPDDTAGIILRTRTAAQDVITLADSDIIPTVNGDSCEGSTAGVPNSITVEVNFIHVLLFPASGMFGGNIPLTASVTDTILSPTCP